MNPITITVCVMFLLALLSLGVIASRVHWAIKAGLIAATLGFVMLFYQTYIDALGWPVASTPPATFQFAGAVVRNPAGADPGAIYLWTIDSKISLMPRSIAMPFSEQLRKTVADAKRRMAHGEPVYMTAGGMVSNSNVSPGGQHGGVPGRSGQAGHGTPGADNHGNAIQIIPPPDTLPKKGG